MAAKLLLFLAHAAIVAPQCCFADSGKEAPYEKVSIGAGKIAVPKGWRDSKKLGPNIVLFRGGDGIGVPAFDETRAPLQIGLTVEKFADAKEPLKSIMNDLVEAAKKAPRLELVGKETVETIRLSDGTEAMLLKVEFIKEGRRRSLQMKLVAKDAGSNAWIVSGHLVGGKESRWPTTDSTLAKWLEAHVRSFTLEATKFDAEKVNAAYKSREQ